MSNQQTIFFLNMKESSVHIEQYICFAVCSSQCSAISVYHLKCWKTDTEIRRCPLVLINVKCGNVLFREGFIQGLEFGPYEFTESQHGPRTSLVVDQQFCKLFVTVGKVNLALANSAYMVSCRLSVLLITREVALLTLVIFQLTQQMMLEWKRKNTLTH